MTHPVKLEQYLADIQQETLQTIDAMNHPEFQTDAVFPRDGRINGVATAVVFMHVHVVRGESEPVLRRVTMSERGFNTAASRLVLEQVAQEGMMSTGRSGDILVSESVQIIKHAAKDSVLELEKTGELYETIGVSEVGITESGDPVLIYHAANNFCDRVVEHSTRPDIELKDIPDEAYRILYAKHSEHTPDIAPYEAWRGEFDATVATHGSSTPRQLAAVDISLLLNPAYSHPTVEARLFPRED